MSANVRRATTTDAAALYVQWSELRRYNASIDHRVVPVPVVADDFAAGLDDVLARDTSVAFVAEVDGKLAGFISGGVERNHPDRLPEMHATVGYLWVAESARRLGVGRQLFDAVREWAAKQDGVLHLEMTVLSADQEAAAFWRSMGFSPFIERVWAALPRDGEA
ncbi:MAG: GNAT family N-acetyltransferase [Tepidiformaceae bacterium]